MPAKGSESIIRALRDQQTCEHFPLRSANNSDTDTRRPHRYRTPITLPTEYLYKSSKVVQTVASQSRGNQLDHTNTIVQGLPLPMQSDIQKPVRLTTASTYWSTTPRSSTSPLRPYKHQAYHMSWQQSSDHITCFLLWYLWLLPRGSLGLYKYYVDFHSQI